MTLLRLPTRNWLRKEAAADLAYRIASYWFVRGYAPSVWTEPVGDEASTKTWVVRSDIVNGRPNKAAEVRIESVEGV